MVMDSDRHSLLGRYELACAGIGDARGLNAIIIAIERTEEALAALILASEEDGLETAVTIARLVNFRSLSRAMRRIG
jgi:hypothetical protein